MNGIPYSSNIMKTVTTLSTEATDRVMLQCSEVKFRG